MAPSIDVVTFAEFVETVIRQRVFITLAITYAITHLIKAALYRFEKSQWSLLPFWATGGMPSSHTAVTVSLTAAVAFESGASLLFFVCTIFALIVIRDSIGVRQSVGEQAKLLNALSGRFKLKKRVQLVLGHTPFQAAVGAAIGLSVTTAVYTLR